MEKKLLTYEAYQLTYFVFGNGDKTLLCFPGYARGGEDYALLSTLLPDHRLICLNYFFTDIYKYHDNPRQSPISKEQYLKFIRALMLKEKIIDCDIVAYSMGARLAMCFLEEHQASKVVFMAPDGLIKSRIQSFVQSRIGAFVFRQFVVKRPRFFDSSIRLLSRLKIISESQQRFLNFYLDTPDKKELVYNTWMSSRDLNPSFEKLNMAKHRYTVFFGTYDRLVKPYLSELLHRNIDETADAVIVESGHNMMKSEIFVLVADVLNKKSTTHGVVL